MPGAIRLLPEPPKTKGQTRSDCIATGVPPEPKWSKHGTPVTTLSSLFREMTSHLISELLPKPGWIGPEKNPVR